MVDPHDVLKEKVDKTLKEKEETPGKKPVKPVYAKDLERVQDNIKFAAEIQQQPVTSDKHDKKIFNHKTVNFNHYIKGQAWPESIFNIDKLLRLNTAASFEWQKRYLKKKRTMPLDIFWVILIFIIVGAALLAAYILLPNFI